jgi:hypothetical protein
VACLLGHHWNQLHASGSSADHADALAREVEALGGPTAGVERGARKGGQPRDVGFQWHRKDSRRRDDEWSDDLLATLGLEMPLRGILVEGHSDDAAVESDVAAKVQSVGNEVEVRLDLRLGRHRLRPHPLLLDLVGEAVRVLDALDVAARARIPVEQPSATDGGGLLQHAGAQPAFPKFVQHVQPREAGPDDHCVVSVVECGIVVDHV